jgi:hypothetical protein
VNCDAVMGSGIVATCADTEAALPTTAALISRAIRVSIRVSASDSRILPRLVRSDCGVTLLRRAHRKCHDAVIGGRDAEEAAAG